MCDDLFGLSPHEHSMKSWLTLEQSLGTSGLRVAPLRAGLPSPWSELGRACLHAELCSEIGFGWHRRVMMIARLLTEPTWGDRERRIGHYLSQKYQRDADTAEASTKHCEEIISVFAGLRTAGHQYLLGPTLTALDLAWATFAALIEPLPEDLCHMTPTWRDLYTWTPSVASSHAVEDLLSLRDRIYRDWLPLPVDVE